MNDNQNQQQNQQQATHQAPAHKPGWFQLGTQWWFHPITVSFAVLLFVGCLLASSAFSYAIGLERTASRMVLGEDMDILHKKILFRSHGYRFVRERDTKEGLYSSGEILVNLESRQKIQQQYEDERFKRASRVGQAQAKANMYSARNKYTDRLVEHIHDKGLEGANDQALDLGYQDNPAEYGGDGQQERLVLGGP